MLKRPTRLTKWYGDLVIERGDGDMYFPNSKAILANGVIVYMSPNELPYPSIIYTGYQRQDVRDPYYTSPIIKQSPMQKFTTIMANKFADATELKVEPQLSTTRTTLIMLPMTGRPSRRSQDPD